METGHKNMSDHDKCVRRKFWAIGPTTELARRPNVEHHWSGMNSGSWQITCAADGQLVCSIPPSTVELWITDTGEQLCRIFIARTEERPDSSVRCAVEETDHICACVFHWWCKAVSFSTLVTYSFPISSSFDSPLLIHNSLSFPPGLKPTCFINPPPRGFTSSRTAFTGYCPDCFFWATPMPTRFLV